MYLQLFLVHCLTVHLESEYYEKLEMHTVY